MALGPTVNVLASVVGAAKGLAKYIIPGSLGIAAAETMTNTDGKGGSLTNWVWRRPSQIAALETSATQGIDDLFDKISGASNNVTTFFAGTLATVCDFLAYVGFEPAARWATSLRGFEQRTQRVINSRVQAGREGVTGTAEGAVPSNNPEGPPGTTLGISNNVLVGGALAGAAYGSHRIQSHYANRAVTRAAAKDAAEATEAANRSSAVTPESTKPAKPAMPATSGPTLNGVEGKSPTATPEPTAKGGKAALFTSLATVGVGAVAGATLMAPTPAQGATPGRVNGVDAPQAPSIESRTTEGVMGGMAALTAIETAKGASLGASLMAKEGLLVAGKRLPIVGGVLTLGFSAASAAGHAWNGELGRAAAEMGTGVAEAAVNTTGLGLIGGGDAVREAARLGVQTVAGDSYAPDKSGIRTLVEHYSSAARGSVAPVPAQTQPAYRPELAPSPFVGMP